MEGLGLTAIKHTDAQPDPLSLADPYNALIQMHHDNQKEEAKK